MTSDFRNLKTFIFSTFISYFTYVYYIVSGYYQSFRYNLFPESDSVLIGYDSDKSRICIRRQVCTRNKGIRTDWRVSNPKGYDYKMENRGKFHTPTSMGKFQTVLFSLSGGISSLNNLNNGILFSK